MAESQTRIFESVDDCIGNTPLIRLRRVTQGCVGTVAVKMESFNPMWSVKDRIAKAMIDAAERDGKIQPGGTVIEATSGNTGVGLAFVCAARGYRLLVTMPDSVSEERARVLKALGADLVYVPAAEGMAGAVRKAEEIYQSDPNAFMPRQFKNPENPEVHRRTTAEEIWRDTDGRIDVFVSAVGTGGTVTGVGEVLKSRKPDVKIVAVEPRNSPVITQTLRGEEPTPGKHEIQGSGAGFIPDILNLDILDEVITVTDDDAKQFARRLSQEEGLFGGFTAGAAAWAATEIARRPEMEGRLIVCVFCDLGERYLSTRLYREESPEEVE